MEIAILFFIFFIGIVLTFNIAGGAKSSAGSKFDKNKKFPPGDKNKKV